jgi:small-conductance mechanosensitive channel
MLEQIKVWSWSMGILTTSAFLGFFVYWIVTAIESRLARIPGKDIHGLTLKHCRAPLRIVLPLLFAFVTLPAVDLPEKFSILLTDSLRTLLILSSGWLLIRLTSVFKDLILRKYHLDAADNLEARKIHTQLMVIRKITIVGITVVTLSVVLMGFERFHELGTGILASAGVAGLVVGLAARTTFSNLLAGVQIALTQPIRIDDAVLVENEWGRVEEITLTYVVVRIWDMRRLILPISYFIEKPFQNWTRISASIIGSVHLHVDYTIAVETLRKEFFRLLEKSPHWDRQVRAMQVVAAGERTMELRAIMSAPDSPAAWDLRCEIREKLIDFIQKKYPDALPKSRVVLEEKGKGGESPHGDISIMR